MFPDLSGLTSGVTFGYEVVHEALDDWFHGSTPRSWLSHAFVWFLVQTGGGFVDGLVNLVRRKRSSWGFRLVAYSGALAYYGYREALDSWRGLTQRDWFLLGDSIMDFLVPVVLNTVVLVWFARRAIRAAREADATLPDAPPRSVPAVKVSVGTADRGALDGDAAPGVAPPMVSSGRPGPHGRSSPAGPAPAGFRG